MSVIIRLIFMGLYFFAAAASAADSYEKHPAAIALIDELVREEGFDRAPLLQVFSQVQRQDSILEAIARPAEKTKAWYEYRKIFLTDKRQQQGAAFYQQYREALLRAERESGVPASVIVAIIGVETHYGRITGRYRVIDALSTLAFDYPPRQGFFTQELKNYLLLTREQGFDPMSHKGSYAGAMGYGQFMPSSYRSYAVDFDGDGVVDIWDSPEDAIGSVANYLARHGWHRGEPVVAAAKAAHEVPDDWFVRTRKDLLPRHTVAELAQAGITSAVPLDASSKAIAIRFQLEDGFEYWLGLHNFYVITRYNHSAKYAMSVYQLSQHLSDAVAP